MTQKPYVIDEMISAKSIAARVEALAREISDFFRGTDKLVVVGLLRGSFVFIADLVRELDLPVEIDFLEVSSYGNATESSREVRILKDLRGEIEGRDVLVVEDIVDTGHTLRHVLDILATRQISQRAASVEQRSLGRWFLEHHPDKAALYAQINHFNPSTHSVPPDRWGATLMGLMQPGRMVPMDALDEVAVPMLMLVGSEDPIVPVAVAREVADRVPGCELAVVEAAGHSSYFEKPAEFNAQVLDFIARRARG